jgi:hypothetical protein
MSTGGDNYNEEYLVEENGAAVGLLDVVGSMHTHLAELMDNFSGAMELNINDIIIAYQVSTSSIVSTN